MASAWAELVEHVKAFSSHLVVLPEMPNDQWEHRFPELGGAAVLGTRPMDFGNERYNEGFVWEPDSGSRPAHAQSLLPNEEGCWEVTWYGDAHVGFLISTELWANDGAHLVATPRITSDASREKWLAAGRTAAVLAGAFGLSSNRADAQAGYGGLGWIIGPDGKTIGMTTDEQPFVTAQIDLAQAERARSTYPRYVFPQKVETPIARQSG
jgi:N-carbamoylputrescine amidase